MTAITKNLPWFIKDLGVGIIGKECYGTLVEELNVTDVPCLKYALSKGLGVGIVVGGSIMKVPQILLIVNARSARGLSLPSYVLETLAYGITLAYSMRNHFPFSTYGENLFLSFQNVLITFLIIFYAPPALSPSASNSKQAKFILATLATGITSYSLSSLPLQTLTILQLATLPLSLLSKLPQIMQNHSSKSTGQLSAFAVFSQIAGCLARLFTTSQEVGDNIVAAGFFLALVLNVVLGTQLYMYWGDSAASSKRTLTRPQENGNGIEMDHLNGRGLGGGHGSPNTAKGTSTGTEVNATIGGIRAPQPSYSGLAAPTPVSAAKRASPVSELGRGVAGTPPPRHGTPTGRKWSRKVD
ncbi:hypothetical protein BKA70DRAFT_1208710 [Coprinopsis sp. MPI-PUGE-AT-0042]|nr:hypothetical protein BKA70DRAFT_1208710 [Coprinopsis sp. MPI-PUGE-AT-0042]